MKKLLFLTILILIPACLFAGAIFDLSMGLDVKLQAKGDDFISEVKNANDYQFDPKDIAPGLAIDAKALIFDVNATIDIPTTVEGKDGDYLCCTGFAGAGLSFDILIVRLSLGAGYSYALNLGPKGNLSPSLSLRSYNAQSYLSSPVEIKSFKDATMDIRAAADVLLGKISVGAYVIMPTDLSLSALEISKVSDGFLGYIKGINGGLRAMYRF